MTTTAKNTANSDKSEKKHPLKNKPFYGIPRNVALMPGITDRLFRLLTILCSAYGDDGHIEFKIATLSQIMQKGDRQTRDLIKEAENKKFVTTKETGRSLQFFLSDIFFENGPKVVQKSADQVGGNPPISYKEQKKGLKEKVVAQIGGQTQVQKPLAAAILLILKNENIEPNKYILEAQNVFGESYTIQLLKVALQKNAKNPTGYIRKNLNHGKKWESIEALIENNIVIDKKEQAIKEGLEHEQKNSKIVRATKSQISEFRIKNYIPSKKDRIKLTKTKFIPQTPLELEKIKSKFPALKKMYLDSECKEKCIRDIIEKMTDNELCKYPSFIRFVNKNNR